MTGTHYGNGYLHITQIHGKTPFLGFIHLAGTLIWAAR